MMARRLVTVTLGLALFLLPACGGGGNSSSQTGGSGSNPIPVPSISSLAPTNANAGGNAFTLTVTGSGFIASSTVRWNASDRTTTFGSSTQLQAAILASDLATAGAVQVTVFNPSPGGGTSNSNTFTINNPGNPVPQVTAISPPAALVGGTSLTLVVTGLNFISSSVLRWNGNDRATTLVNGTQLRASIPASDIATKGMAQVTVFNPAPGGGVSGAATFTITLFGPFVSFNLQGVTAPWVDAGPMAIGNFDSDSTTDLAVTDLLPLNIHLGFGNGIGGFSFGLMNLPAINVIAADFNGDGRTDLAFTTELLGSQVAVFLGDGQGNFSQSWQYGYPSNSCEAQGLGRLDAIAEGDVNGDGKLDLIVGHTGFSVFLGKGDGTFAQPTDFNCTAGANTESTAIVAADFNNDGNTDLAIVDALQSSLTVWLNSGTASFSALPPLPRGGFIFGGSLVSADFDLDGNPDLAAKANSNMVFVYFGSGDGTFIGPEGIKSTVMDPNGFLESVLSAVDVNGDSIPDLTMSGPSDQNQFPATDTAVDVFLSKGNRTFSLTGSAIFFGGAGGIASFDVDGNGRVDILLGGNGTLWEMLNQ
jgi:hypothetical protein